MEGDGRKLDPGAVGSQGKVSAAGPVPVGGPNSSLECACGAGKMTWRGRISPGHSRVSEGGREPVLCVQPQGWGRAPSLSQPCSWVCSELEGDTCVTLPRTPRHCPGLLCVLWRNWVPKQEQPIRPTGCAGSGGCGLPWGHLLVTHGGTGASLCPLGGQQRPQAVNLPCDVETSEITLLVSFQARRAHGEDNRRSFSLR